MKKNNEINNIQSFKDFETQKIQLYYQVKLSEKKLEIKFFTFKEQFSVLKVLSTIIGEIIAPVIKLMGSSAKNYIEILIQKSQQRHEERKNTK